MPRPPWELGLAMLAILGSAAWYGYAARHGAPPPGGVTGHALGIAGFVLMLGAETLYTLRKHARRFTRGPLSLWLQVHVFIGLVGAWLVLLHTAGRFHGLAGVTAWLTVLVVLSGFVGRYIYTAAPRGLDGVEIGAAQLEQQIAELEAQLRERGIELTGPVPWSSRRRVPAGG